MIHEVLSKCVETSKPLYTISILKLQQVLLFFVLQFWPANRFTKRLILGHEVNMGNSAASGFKTIVASSVFINSNRL